MRTFLQCCRMDCGGGFTLQEWLNESWTDLKRRCWEKAGREQRADCNIVEYCLILPWKGDVLLALYAEYYRDRGTLYAWNLAEKEPLPQGALDPHDGHALY